MKKIYMILIAMTFLSTSLYASKGKIRIASQKGAYIYVDGKKKAMVGEGYTSILLEEGEYTIKVQKNSSDGKWIYKASKKVFVGGDTSTKINFELIKNLKDDSSNNTFIGHTSYVSSVAISQMGNI